MAKKPITVVLNPLNINMVLLAALSAAPSILLTQAEGQPLIEAELAELHPELGTSEEKAAVVITEKGRAYLVENTPVAVDATIETTSATAPASNFQIRGDIPIPEAKNNRGGNRKPSFPFEKLELNQSFHIGVKVNKTPEDLLKLMSSNLTRARKSFAVETGETKSVKDRTTGDLKTVSVYKYERDFAMRVVDATDPDGAGVRIWRTV